MSKQGNQEGGGRITSVIRSAPWAMLALLLIAGGVGGFALLQILRPQPAPAPSLAEATLVRAQPIERREGPLPVHGQGFVRPRAEVRLTAEIGAQITEVSPSLVSGGSFAAGDVLVRLDPRRFEAALAQARGDLKAQAARLGFAEKQLARAARLKSGGFAAEARVDELESQKQQAAAAMEALEARIAQLELDLENTRIIAPFGGIVRSENVEPGDVVQPGSEIARIFASDRYEIVVGLDDSDALLIPGLWQEGGGNAPALVSTAYGETRWSWPGRVTRAERALDERARTVNIVVGVENPLTSGRPAEDHSPGRKAPPLLVGSFADVRIDGVDPGPHALVPRSALHDGNTALLISPENTLTIVPVDILYEDGDTAYVLAETLDGYERIVVSALETAIPGMAVRELSEEPQSGGSGAP